MPVYLCQPGHASPEPWRHGVQVYAYPFRIDGGSGVLPPPPPAPGAAAGGGRVASSDGSIGFGDSDGSRGLPSSGDAASPRAAASAAASPASSSSAAPPAGPAGSHPNRPSVPPPGGDAGGRSAADVGVGVAVRRVRHAEVVLADEVSACYGRYWLRLRWPGPRGGVAGYIALGLVPQGKGGGGAAGGCSAGAGSLVAPAGGVTSESAMEVKERTFRIRTRMSDVSDMPTRPSSRRESDAGDDDVQDDAAPTADDNDDDVPLVSAVAAAAAAEAAMAAAAGDDGPPPKVDQQPNSASATPTAAPLPPNVFPPRCESTGLYFPSSSAMELLASYDDGLAHNPALRRADSAGSDGDAPGHGHGNLGQQIGGIFHPHHRDGPSSSSSSGGGGSGGGGASSGSDHHQIASSAVSLSSQPDAGGGEPVFCRICREGLHDVNYDLDAAGAGGGGNQGGGSGGAAAAFAAANYQAGVVAPPPPPPPPAERQDAAGGAGRGVPEGGGAPLHPPGVAQFLHPVPSPEMAAAAAAAAAASSVVPHHPFAENPLLAPCSCTGSMAFVHYLCVEQWRCRSRHPSARNGLNCETCGGEYTLPPPPTRPAVEGGGARDAAGAGGVLADEDWLEAMPPHVLAALRRPHPWWQIGTAIVRRRWLRPVAPVLMSPAVALYCRARRMLKKRGVSRRRWACSLCRRRARWKCVRCLRSYYCSRQCQNVSWHIVHKHVCYKPARFWWSLVVYGVGTVLAFPGVLRDPVVYDLGLSCLLGSFVVMGVIGGGIATAMKRGLGVDIRGRTLELAVVLLTFFLASVAWGLVWGFFGDTSRCWGVASGAAGWWAADDGEAAAGDVADPPPAGVVEDGGGGPDGYDAGMVARFWRRCLFRPAKIGIGALDKAWAMTGPLVTRLVCSADDGKVEDGDDGARTTATCLRMARKADPDFFLPEHGGEKCASDLVTVTSVLIFSGVVLFVGAAVKKRERNRRAAAAAAARAAGAGRAVARAERNPAVPRPHQD